MSWARRILITVSVVVAIFVLAVVLLFTVDLGYFKSNVEDYVSQKIGRQLVIAGAFEPALGSTIDLVAEDVTLSNADWGVAENILELQRVVISVDTWSLFSGPIQVLNLEVEGLNVHVERNPETRRNSWSFTNKPKRAPGAPLPRFELPLWLNEARLQNINVTYGQGWLETPREISVSEANVFADDSNLLNMNLVGAIGDEPIEANGLAGPLQALIDGHGPRWELQVSIGQFLASTEGTFANLMGFKGPAIHAVMKGPEAERTLARFGLPLLASGPVDIEANLNAVPEGLELLMKGAFGDLTTDIVARAKSFRTISDLDLSVDVQGPNLQAIGELFGADFLPPTKFSVKGEVNGTSDDLNLDSIVVSAGDARLEVDGKLASPEVDPTAALRLTASGPEIHDFLPPALSELLPSGAFDARANAVGGPRQLQLKELTARVGEFELELEGSLPFVSNVAGLDIAVSASGPNFEQLVEPWFDVDVLAEPYSASARVRNAGAGYIVNDLILELSSANIKMVGTSGLLPTFEGLNASISLAGEDMQATFGPWIDVDLPAIPFKLDGDIVASNGALQMSNVSYRVGDAHGTLDGTSGELPTLEGLRVNSSLAGPDASRFSSVFEGTEESELVPAEAFETRGLISLTGGIWFVDPWMLQIGESRLEFRGSLGDFSGAAGLDLQIVASGPDIRRFLPDRGIEVPVPYDVNGGLRIADGTIELREVDLRIAKTTAWLNGRVLTSADEKHAEFELRIAGPNLERVGQVFDVSGLPSEAYRVEGSLKRAGQSLSVGDLVAVVGEDDVSGNFTLELGDRTRLSGQLASDNLDLTQWLGKDDSGAESDEAAPDSDRVIPDTALPLQLLDMADLDVTLRLRHLKTENLDVGDVELKIVMDSDELHVETGQVSLKNGGDMSAVLDVMRSGDAQAEVQLSVSGQQYQLRPSVDGDGNPISRPPEDLTLTLSANGATVRDLAATANGNISLRLGEGDFENDLGGYLMRDLVSQILGTINPLSRNEKNTHLDCGFVEVDVVDGVAGSRAVGFQTDRISVASIGSIDFGSEAMDLSFRVKQREGIGVSVAGIVNPYVKVGGTMASPAFEFDKKRGFVTGAFAFLTGGLSVLAQGVWDRHLAKDDYCEAIIEALESGEIPAWEGNRNGS
jgi:uncharacterized protein involved in outer membrane biogenesis